MKRFFVLTLLMALAALCWVPPVQAQTPNPPNGSNVTINVGHKLARFLVDGREYLGSAAFFWPTGTKHVIEFQGNEQGFQFNSSAGTRFLFGGWTTNLAGLLTPGARTLAVQADPGLTTITGNLLTEHRVKLRFFEAADQEPDVIPPLCTNADPDPRRVRPGVVFFGAICYWNNTDIWVTEGQFPLQALAYPGYVFLGWKTDGTLVDGASAGQFKLSGPMTVYARFSPAKRVNFRTEPSGLKVRIDRGEIRTTEIEPCEPNNYLLPTLPPRGIRLPCIGEFDFAPGSPHLIAPVSPQMDKYGKHWVFDSFSTGQRGEFTYQTPAEIYPEETIKAKYVRGVVVSYLTKPAGLNLKVNDRDNWPETYFVVAPGTRQRIQAPLEQNDARGRKYVFRRWSNGGAAAQEVTVPESAVEPGFTLVAEYDLLSQLTIRSNPAGATVTVDGAACPTPCRIDRKEGTEVVVSAAADTQLSDVHRLQFHSWSNAGAAEQRVAVAGSEVQTLTANYLTAFRLQIASDPPEGSVIRVTDATPDNFYPSGAIITITAEEQQGYRFRRWDIDVSGTGRTAVFAMSGPRTALARLDKVPYIPPAGIRNAAAATPEGVVAPGSLITIAGGDLAPYYEAGPQGPILSQVLAGTSVVVGSRILPLLFVSPEQINAQLPRDLAAGEYELHVIRAGQVDITGKFRVVTAAPGLFNQPVDEKQYAVARHANGEDVTIANPARKGEEITLVGTGFGRYQLPHPEGFALPPGPGFNLASDVLLQLGDLSGEVTWAGGAAGQVGIDMVRFKIPEELPAQAANLQVTVKVDEHPSNTVVLPVQQ